jgi:hypothetical protein
MRSTPYVASLRIYEPIGAFALPLQHSWSSLFNSQNTVLDEQLKALKRIIKDNWQELMIDGIHFIDFEGRKYVAPWSTNFRCRKAIEDFKSTLPLAVAQFFISKKIDDLINRSGELFGGEISHILTSNWDIPLRWFVLFTPDDRIRGEDELGHFTVARTNIVNAISRCRFAHQALTRAFGEGTFQEDVAQLLTWLHLFDKASIVELDYGGLAEYLHRLMIESGENGLNEDKSIEEVSSLIISLSQGNRVLAGENYGRVISRWMRVRALESAF